MYSSIEEDQRKEVINNCYWPLLRLARELNLPFGIEATGNTLEIAAAIDPDWINELRVLTNDGPCEFVGSGYAQLIKPLVPAGINRANLYLGHEVYERLLGHRPEVALVNEQAYSAGLVQHYLDADYKAIIMEWNNPAHYHPRWNQKWRYLPQYACGQYGERIPLIWNNSIAFQKFQRYAHGDIELEEYSMYLQSHLASTRRSFPLYGNDVEIFDFRPGRYRTEADINEEGEWNRLKALFYKLTNDQHFSFIPPREVLNLLSEPEAGNDLHLESSEQPVPVKKQGKYNLTRWAVTGRNDLGINTACRQLYETIKDHPQASDQWWRELCYLWSSDFRTHITEKRWKEYLHRLESFRQEVNLHSGKRADFPVDLALDHCKENQTNEGLKKVTYEQKISSIKDKTVEQTAKKNLDMPVVKKEGHYLYVEANSLCLKLNCKKGLAIEGLWPGNKNTTFILGTLGHGFYDDITLGADWFSGHVVLELMGHPKITDLVNVEPGVCQDEETDVLKIWGTIPYVFGTLRKEIHMHTEKPQISLNYIFDWKEVPFGSIRLGNITLNPDAFDHSSLFYRSCNGGIEPEKFDLTGTRVNHGEAVSFLVSASGGIGLSDGRVELGDAKNVVRVDLDPNRAAMLGLITYYEVGDSFFYRLSFSAGEVDDTSKFANNKSGIMECKITLNLVNNDDG